MPLDILETLSSDSTSASNEASGKDSSYDTPKVIQFSLDKSLPFLS